MPDDALSEHGFERGQWVEIELGEVWQGDLGGIRRGDGCWFVGYLFFGECGIRILPATPYYQSQFVQLDDVAAHGRVVGYRGRDVSARWPRMRGIRFRFKV